MGGPTSAIVSEIYMQALEMTAIKTADHPPKIWERHVDDVFSVMQRILPSRTTTLHQQPAPTNTIHKRRRTRFHTIILRHPSSTESRQNHISKSLQKTNTYQPIPELYFTSFNIYKKVSSLIYLIEQTTSSQVKKTKKKKNNISWQP